MEAGPRDSEDTPVDGVRRVKDAPPRVTGPADGPESPEDVVPAAREGHGTSGASQEPEDPEDALGLDAGLQDEDPEQDLAEPQSPDEAAVEPQELRPQRKLRLWQIAPIVVLGALGSLMFAFPLAFEPGGGSGDVVSMLGLLICGCAAGGGVMAARRVGLTWPGLPARGSGNRPDWRVVAVYAVLVVTVVVLAVWRVARLH